MEDMASPNRRSKRSVTDELFEEGYRFDFYQAVTLLERLNPSAFPVGETVEANREAVRFRSEVSLRFPPTEVCSISPATESRPVLMETNFMGLAGVLGPLPNAVTEIILNRMAQKDFRLP